jgi:uncharacterized Rmd1/YagE family protein
MFGFWKEVVVLVKEVFLWLIRKRKTIKDSIEIGNKIDRILEDLRADTGADRAYVFQFHNGSYFYTGNSIDKMTNTHEKVGKGVSHEQLKYRDVGTAPFRFLIEQIIKGKPYICNDCSSIHHYNTKLMMIDRGSKSIVLKAMFDALKRPVGFIGIDYVKSKEVISKVVENKVDSASESIYDILVYGKTNK